MENVSASLVKSLRMRTGVGILECKKALIESNGNIELAIDYLRTSGIKNAKKKIRNTTLQGSIFLKIKNNFGVILEINSETDFASRSTEFNLIGTELAKIAIEKKIKGIDELKNIFEKKRLFFINQFSENISIRRIKFLNGESLGSYMHNSRIGVLVSSDLKNVRTDILHQLAMHIAANDPEYISSDNIPKHITDREYEIQLNLSKRINKKDFVIKKILEGRMKKYVNSICLMEQNFLLDNTKKVKDVLLEHKFLVKNYIRFELGR
ncbi:translation elongation factor Ts [Buchnera aphidicola]|uniref:Elongation factor Ts n=1 Tax=Buchnera aphidicola (Anoecia oenotherae) TaxID=1241833 RepID=A0A4D6XPT7_9GAMM|nr:translation elongation factor Ts [Buchnera aphidicola]QCI19312.1 elongation factor Ts [Buchnera aphidicola (Anoecia oenotherae)]